MPQATAFAFLQLNCVYCNFTRPRNRKRGYTLIVVEDRGGKSAQPYYQAIRPLSPTKTGASSPSRPSPKRGEAAMLPVRSLKLSPGNPPRRALQTQGWSRPVFLVGDDETSHRWLKANGARLKAMGAVGLVVQVETAKALARLRARIPGVPLSPVSGDDLAERLGISHYPVLISATGIEP
jgi:integrating conjugative element protein (TIGR03765 family)